MKSSRYDELFRMAYSAEWDGYDRNWHASFASSHSDRAALAAGAKQAAAEIAATNRAP